MDFLWDYLCPHSGFSIGKVFHFVINSLYQYLYYFIVLLVCVCGIFFFFLNVVLIVKFIDSARLNTLGSQTIFFHL